jgi:hypothetical protein
MASGISLVSFNSRGDGMHQRSYSVSSADQWSEATVIANSGVSTGMRKHTHTVKEPGTGLKRNQATPRPSLFFPPVHGSQMGSDMELRGGEPALVQAA